jgi:hypothetical protein
MADVSGRIKQTRCRRRCIRPGSPSGALALVQTTADHTARMTYAALVRFVVVDIGVQTARGIVALDVVKLSR